MTNPTPNTTTPAFEPRTQQTPRQPVSHRWVWIGLLALALVVLGVFVLGYWFLVRYEDKVARHLPTGAVAALRLDIEQVVLYQPIRKHVFPVLDGAKTHADRLAKLKAETGVNLGMDLREILIATLADGQYVALIGGLFPESGLLDKAVRVLPADHGCVAQGARFTCQLAGAKLWFEQAADGVVIASNSEQALVSALTGSEEGVALGLQQAPITLAVRWKDALSGLPVEPIALGMPVWVNELAAIFGQADLGDPLQVQLKLQGLSAERVGVVRAWLQQMQTLAGLVRGPDVLGERDALARATVEVGSDGAVALRTSWARADLDRAARAFADWLEATLRL